MYALLLAVLLALGAPPEIRLERWPDGTPRAEFEVRVEADGSEVLHGSYKSWFENGKVELHMGDMEIDWPTMLASLKDAPVGEYVTVESDEADVVVRKEADMILIDVDEKSDEQAKVKVLVPLTLIDALTLDEDNRIDIAALLRGFDGLPDGDLVTVESAEANVRVWVE